MTVVRDKSKNWGVGRGKGLCCLKYLLGSNVTWTLIYSGIALVRSITNTSSKYNSVFEELSFAFFFGNSVISEHGLEILHLLHS